MRTFKTDQEAKEEFQKNRTKMLTNWKVLEDGIITKESTPTEIFQYAQGLDCELWIEITMSDLLMHWSMKQPSLDNVKKEDRTQVTVDSCNNFFS